MDRKGHHHFFGRHPGYGFKMWRVRVKLENRNVAVLCVRNEEEGVCFCHVGA